MQIRLAQAEQFEVVGEKGRPRGDDAAEAEQHQACGDEGLPGEMPEDTRHGLPECHEHDQRQA